jgi:methyltransferase (TIGR00027 family)
MREAHVITLTKEHQKMSENASANPLLGLTARHTAAARARESQREDRLFNDRWAEQLSGKEGREWIEHQAEDHGISVIVRTRFFDDFLGSVTGEPPILQVVLLAAGLDTRAYRLTWPEHTRLFELDQPEVLSYKELVLNAAGAKPACERKVILVDLTTPWSEALFQAGFDSQQPSAWLIEGLLLYLPDEQIARLLDEITRLAPLGSRLGFDIINRDMLTSPWTKPLIDARARAGTPWIGTMDDPVAELAARGWRARLSQPGEAEANYGRWPYPVIPQTMPSMPRHWLVTAQKT